MILACVCRTSEDEDAVVTIKATHEGAPGVQGPSMIGGQSVLPAERVFCPSLMFTFALLTALMPAWPFWAPLSSDSSMVNSIVSSAEQGLRFRYTMSSSQYLIRPFHMIYPAQKVLILSFAATFSSWLSCINEYLSVVFLYR